MLTHKATEAQPQLRFVFDSDGDLRCPVCGECNVHLGPVIVDQGHVVATCSGGRVDVSPSRRHEKHRGSAVSLGFFCESGHAFRYGFDFHKGLTSVYQDVADLSEDDDGGLFLPPELWRN